MLRWTALSTLLPMLLAIAAGVAVPFQAAANAALGRELGHPLWATLMSLAISVLVLLPVMMSMHVTAPDWGAALHGPAWRWLGGVAGVIYISIALILTPRLGAAGFIVSVIVGQMLASLLIDHFGLLEMAQRPINLGRLSGIMLMVAGMAITQMYSVRATPGAEY